MLSLQVDDVLLNRRLPLVGASAISAVHFVHPGYTLCPIEAPHAQQQLELHSQQQDVQVEYLSQQGLQPSMSQVATSCREAGQAHPNECLQGGGTGSGAASSSGDGCEGRLQTLGAFVPTDCLDSEGSDSSAGEADSS